MRLRIAVALTLLAIVLVIGIVARAKPAPAVIFHAVERLARQRLVATDVRYRAANGWIGQIDIYRPPAGGDVPAALFLHGGGWISGSKDTAAFWVLPFLARGYAVVAASYRLGDIAPAPAAVEDVRCALGWLQANAGAYHIDPSRIVTAGDSAGGHLALMAGLLRTGDGFDTTCEHAVRHRVAAVVSIYGVSDVAALAEAQARQPADGVNWPFALRWLGAEGEHARVARRVSPLSWIRDDSPPVLVVHGTADALVPFTQARALHEALQAAAVRHELVAIDGGGHGDFSPAQWAYVARRLVAFLPR